MYILCFMILFTTFLLTLSGLSNASGQADFWGVDSWQLACV